MQTRLKTMVGEDVWANWFTSLSYEGCASGTMNLSVPTRFLKSWIQGHYAEKLLQATSAEIDGVKRINLSIRQPGAVVQRAALDDGKADAADAAQPRQSSPTARRASPSSARTRSSTRTPRPRSASGTRSRAC